MHKFFFDVKTGTSINYDYKGREFSTSLQAQSFAELVALDVACTENADAADEVQVRDIDGEKLFIVSVQQIELVAA
jgi:hypothetical protein